MINQKHTIRSKELEQDLRWQLVERITNSTSFLRAHRLSEFLRYVVSSTILGDSQTLNEQIIGEAVFKRPAGYDSREDNIVRAHASRLRQRLENYFANEGLSENLHIKIPRGSYVPVFEQQRGEAVHAQSAHEDVDDLQTFPNAPADALVNESVKREVKHTQYLRIAILIVCIAILATACIYIKRAYLIQDSFTPTQLLWKQMFQQDKNTLIVPADSSLVLLSSLINLRVHLADYANGSYRNKIICTLPCNQDELKSISSRRYTSIADLEFAVALTRLPESIPNRTQIRFVRDLQLEDFKQSNLILIGSLEADPWLELLEGQLDFELQDDSNKSRLQVINHHPHEHEQSAYEYDSHQTPHRGLATVAFLPNLSGNGHILLVQGFTLADTEAASEFLTDGNDLNQLFLKYSTKRRSLPHFECLLQTSDINGVSSHPHILAWHIRGN
ncbi:MAG: hypothetical protein P4K83_02755 [Terracidiphilus sp.]|nr:hypothetical protein [Terracidiphilus sp.]